MNDDSIISEAIKGLGKNQALFLKSLYLSPQSSQQPSSIKIIMLNLEDRGLIKRKEKQVFLTDLGKAVCEFWKEQNGGELEDATPIRKQEPSKSIQAKKANLEKSNQFLELYKQGLSYQDIGDQHAG